MRNIEYTEYKGKTYKGFTLDGSVLDLDYDIYLLEDTIAPALMPNYPDSYDYADAEAQMIDESCYAFVPAEWFSITKKEFTKRFRENYD